LQHSRRDKFDRIVVETTGLANPAPIIQTFFLEPSVAEGMKLDGVVTLVDAKHAEQHLDEIKPEGIVNEAIEQVAFADRIVLNKTDLVGTEDLDRLENRIRNINSLAALHRAQRANVPMEYVLGIGGFDLEKVEDDLLAADKRHQQEEASHDDHQHHHQHQHDHEHEDSHDHECGPRCTHASHDHNHDHHHHEHDHVHDDSVTSVSLTINGGLDLDKVNFWLGGLLEVRGEDIFRMKGVLSIEGFDRRFVFQGVHMLFEGMPDREWKEGEERQSKMVFIGRDLDAGIIREGFEQCVVSS
jgi:G3E family GTPase